MAAKVVRRCPRTRTSDVQPHLYQFRFDLRLQFFMPFLRGFKVDQYREKLNPERNKKDDQHTPLPWSSLCDPGGGGEPTLHKDFEEVVRYIKSKRLQVGIVTNGSRLEKVEAVVEDLEEKDWIRISIDAAGEEVYHDLHLPKHHINVSRDIRKSKKGEKKESIVSMGYSFVVVWEGVEIEGKRLHPNMEEMARSVELAKEFSFDYVSFKPCLIRLMSRKGKPC